ncbi:fused uroporphyrinogen-III synthase HemD/membrane protein HemX [Cupriavidus sp. MP-37]|uniref:fused uroporphyrinogen-III synthase HemD/membrane protein HemX n=1 Tax=Cupriavidus sp. MP-37 TaxID=2884455 RepID=UPI001D0A3B97|nr:fused uroporphyrinogen-III synthase HemD/membrane protein HemX [Cupriavidus sp. MP-37]UDM51207.1 fused uroporphyrinogen-III synthase HemD/membrane protein HemX [Cupriavidus sp. MP-37]
MPRPTVVVTRPAGQSRQLTEALQGAGLDVLSFPLLAIGPAADDAPLRAALARLDTFALVVFVSPNAIAFALDALAGVQGTAAARWPAQVAVAVVGPASVAALAERGISAPAYRVIAPAGANAPGHDDTMPDAEALRFDSEALWAQLDPAALAGKPVLIIRGNGGRDWLGDRLREAGAQVEAVEAYQRTLPEPGAMQWQAVRDHLRPGAAPHAWLLTSSEAVRNLDVLARQHLSPQEDASLRQVQCIAPHARIAEQALALGFAHIQRAAPGDAGLLAACLQWADAFAGPAPSSLPAPSGPAAAKPAEAAAPPAASPPAAVPATSTKVERVTQETTSSSATPPPGAASVHPAQSAQAVPPQGAGHAGAARPAARRSAALWALVAVLVVATAGGFWWLQQRVDHLTGELARRQQSNDALVQESRVLTRNAQDTVKELQAKVGVLENQVGETRDKQVALEQVYQDLMRNRDDWEIAEIQQLLTSAGQQLQLTGNVQVALAALQSADARLARTDKPQYNLLRRAIARDVARMKAVPDTDLTGAAIKLDEAINQVDALPLLSSERMLERSEADARKGAAANGGNGAQGASAPAAANGTGPGWFTRFWDYLREELAQVIRIRKVDDAEALLLSGDQGWFLRENVKLRLLNARLALLSRNEPVFRNDLAAAQAMIGRYFDTKSRRVQGVLTLLRQAQAGAVSVQLPTMAESLGALQALKKE